MFMNYEVSTFFIPLFIVWDVFWIDTHTDNYIKIVNALFTHQKQ